MERIVSVIVTVVDIASLLYSNMHVLFEMCVVAYVNLAIMYWVHSLSDNSVRSVYLGYIYPMYYMASLLPMFLTFITLWSSMEVVWD